jgi:hypothetical protein
MPVSMWELPHHQGHVDVWGGLAGGLPRRRRVGEGGALHKGWGVLTVGCSKAVVGPCMAKRECVGKVVCTARPWVCSPSRSHIPAPAWHVEDLDQEQHEPCSAFTTAGRTWTSLLPPLAAALRLSSEATQGHHKHPTIAPGVIILNMLCTLATSLCKPGPALPTPLRPLPDLPAFPPPSGPSHTPGAPSPAE